MPVILIQSVDARTCKIMCICRHAPLVEELFARLHYAGIIDVDISYIYPCPGTVVLDCKSFAFQRSGILFENLPHLRI